MQKYNKLSSNLHGSAFLSFQLNSLFGKNHEFFFINYINSAHSNWIYLRYYHRYYNSLLWFFTICHDFQGTQLWLDQSDGLTKIFVMTSNFSYLGIVPSDHISSSYFMIDFDNYKNLPHLRQHQKQTFYFSFQKSANWTKVGHIAYRPKI